MMRTHGKAQGWYRDPFRRHETRWFSDGNPTSLVRDEGIESTDPPPNARYSGHPEPAAEVEGEGDGDAAVRGIWDIFVSTGGD
jgi:hypothetical protein